MLKTITLQEDMKSPRGGLAKLRPNTETPGILKGMTHDMVKEGKKKNQSPQSKAKKRK